MATDIVSGSPRQVAAESSLGDVLRAVRAVETWDDRPAEVLDQVYCQRIARLWRRTASADELEELSDHLEQVLHDRRRSALDSLRLRYGARWEGFRDILDFVIETRRQVDPERVLSRAHVVSILHRVAASPLRRISQSSLRSMGLKEANLTRVLNLMEANGLIDRIGIGRGNEIRLTDLGAASLDASEKPPDWSFDAPPVGDRFVAQNQALVELDLAA